MKRIICLILTLSMLFSLITVSAEGDTVTANSCTFLVSGTASETVKSGDISAKFSITNSTDAADEYVAFNALYVSGALTDIAMSAATVEAGATAEIATGTVTVDDPTVAHVKAFVIYQIDGDNHKMDTFEMGAYVEEEAIDEGFVQVPEFKETEYYRIYNKWSKEYIYDKNGIVTFGDYDSKNRDKFLWQIAKDGDVYRIKNKLSNNYLISSADGSITNTREVDVSEALSNWDVLSKDGETLMFRNAKSNNFLNVKTTTNFAQCSEDLKDPIDDDVWSCEWYFVSAIMPSPSDNAKEFKDYTTEGLEEGKIYALTPKYCADVNGDIVIKVAAPGVKTVVAKCWQGGDDEWGHDALIATAKCNKDGFAMFTFPADEFPHGPAIIRISDMFGKDTCHLQLYNTGGYSWEEGLAEAPVPPIVLEKGLNELFADDFDNAELGIRDAAHVNAKYYSHKKGGGDFSGIPFTDVGSSKNPFSQVDTYMRIRADQQKNSSGIVSSLFNDMSGFAVKVPAYFECKFIAQNAKGSWPAFWTLSTDESGINPNGTDELDIIEAYGFDSSQPQNPVTGYTATSHTWGYDSEVRLGSGNDHLVLNQTAVNSGGAWFTNFHTYGLYIDEEWTIYYHDNQEIWRHKSFERTQEDYTWFLINYAFGGASGWQYDLSRYDYRSDMYVDWVRVYGLEENLLNKPKEK